jgi:UDP-glucose 4-epimerase
MLGWQPTWSDLETIVRTATAWHRRTQAAQPTLQPVDAGTA